MARRSSGKALRASRQRRALFELSALPAPPETVVATIDGAARGNPGPAAYGVVFHQKGGKVLAQLGGRLHRTTNNVAEYHALVAALSYARQQGWRALKVRTDSELLARQLQGTYRVRSADLKPLHDEARRLAAAFDYFGVEAVPRKLTRSADKLANAALDSKLGTHRRKTPATADRTIRAVYEAGVLKPREKLDLPEGEEIELTFRKPPRR